MPDITMCMSHTCVRALECYRHEAIPSYYQSMAPFENGPQGCDRFWPIEDPKGLAAAKKRLQEAQPK